MTFEGRKCRVKNKQGSLVLEGSLTNNKIYKLNLQPHPSTSTATALEVRQDCSMALWHRRMAHLNSNYLKQLRHAALGVQFADNKFEKCEICVAGKLTNKPFRATNSRAAGLLQLVHSDVCQVKDLSLGKAKYFITFLDDYSRKLFVYFFHSKDEVPKIVQSFVTFAENQSSQKLKVLRTDNGREYLNSTLKMFLDHKGIKHETSIAYQPQSNGRAERMNRVLLEKVRCMLAESSLPKQFWAEAMSTACYLSNRSPKKSLNGRTPEEV